MIGFKSVELTSAVMRIFGWHSSSNGMRKTQKLPSDPSYFTACRGKTQKATTKNALSRFIECRQDIRAYVPPDITKISVPLIIMVSPSQSSNSDSRKKILTVLSSAVEFYSTVNFYWHLKLVRLILAHIDLNFLSTRNHNTSGVQLDENHEN